MSHTEITAIDPRERELLSALHKELKARAEKIAAAALEPVEKEVYRQMHDALAPHIRGSGFSTYFVVDAATDMFKQVREKSAEVIYKSLSRAAVKQLANQVAP